MLGDRAAAGKHQPSQKLTVRQANIPVAMLVGFFGRRSSWPSDLSRGIADVAGMQLWDKGNMGRWRAKFVEDGLAN